MNVYNVANEFSRSGDRERNKKPEVKLLGDYCLKKMQ